MNNNEMVSVPFKREDRYIVIKRSDLANVPVNYRSALVDPLTPLLAHLPSRECLVIESDWPEYVPTWAAIEARVTGKPAEQHHGEPYGWAHDDGKEFTTSADYASDLQKEGIAVTPLYTHADPGEAERLREQLAEMTTYRDNGANEIIRLHDKLAELREGIAKHWKVVCDQRAQLADLKRRHDVLHRDMATIAGREVPKGVTVSDYAAAAIADALSGSAGPSSTAWGCGPCKVEMADKRPCDLCGAEPSAPVEHDELPPFAEKDELASIKRLHLLRMQKQQYDHSRQLSSLQSQIDQRDSLLRDCFTAMLKGGYAKPLRERIKVALAASAEPSAPIERDERTAFETSYAREFSKARGQDLTAEDIASMRDSSGGYGDRAYLNGQWAGWQARATLERKP